MDKDNRNKVIEDLSGHTKDKLSLIIDHSRPIYSASAKIVFFKHIDFSYAGCNEELVKFSRLESDMQILGRTDMDMPWAEGTPFYRKVDKQVLNGAVKEILMSVRVASGEEISAIQSKKPIRDEQGEIIGIMAEMSQVATKSALKTPEIIQRIDKKAFYDSAVVESRYLMERYIDYGLTHRESECLFYLIRGFPVKLIARKMKISDRTVEFFLTKIREKFNCLTKADLVEKVYNDGAVAIVPPQVDFNFLREQL